MFIGVDRGQEISCKEGKIKELYSYGIIPIDNDGEEAYCGASSKGS